MTQASRSRRPCRSSSRRSGRSSGRWASLASSRLTSRTSIYPKLTAYIDRWIVDIGDKVKKGRGPRHLVRARTGRGLRHEEGDGQARNERVKLANKMVEVADADVNAAEAKLDEAKAILAKYQAEVDRWDDGGQAAHAPGEPGVVDPQISSNRPTSGSRAPPRGRGRGRPSPRRKRSFFPREATLAKAKVDVSVAQADLAVADRAKRSGSRPGLATSRSPASLDGVVVSRNANTFDFVLPSPGDPSADTRAPHLSPLRRYRCRSTWSTGPTSSGSSSTSPSRTPITFTAATCVCCLRSRTSESCRQRVGNTGRRGRCGEQLHFRIFDSEGQARWW